MDIEVRAATALKAMNESDNIWKDKNQKINKISITVNLRIKPEGKQLKCRFIFKTNGT